MSCSWNGVLDLPVRSFPFGGQPRPPGKTGWPADRNRPVVIRLHKQKPRGKKGGGAQKGMVRSGITTVKSSHRERWDKGGGAGLPLSKREASTVTGTRIEGGGGRGVVKPLGNAPGGKCPVLGGGNRGHRSRRGHSLRGKKGGGNSLKNNQTSLGCSLSLILEGGKTD